MSDSLLYVEAGYWLEGYVEEGTPTPSGSSGNNFAGGRRGYIIRDKRYWLNDFELAYMLAEIEREAQQAVRRSEVLHDAPKPKVLSKKIWAALKATLQSLEALAYEEPVQVMVDDESDDEQALLMLL